MATRFAFRPIFTLIVGQRDLKVQNLLTYQSFIDVEEHVEELVDGNLVSTVLDLQLCCIITQL